MPLKSSQALALASGSFVVWYRKDSAATSQDVHRPSLSVVCGAQVSGM